jgi:feruloyl esterase
LIFKQYTYVCVLKKTCRVFEQESWGDVPHEKSEICMSYLLKSTAKLCVVSAAIGALTACGGGDNGDSPPLPAAKPPATGSTFIGPKSGVANVSAACAALVGAMLPAAPAKTAIVWANYRAATASLPSHCEIKGTINAGRQGVDGQIYATKWHMRLPVDWNGRFYFAGGGGINGSLGSASDRLPERYAVISQDSGHANDADPDYGANDSVNNDPRWANGTFGFDPESRVDFGYRSYGQVAIAGKEAVKVFYGQAPYYSYYVGLSEGGREALVVSQRYPDLFEGVAAGIPGMDLPRATIAEAYDSQQLAIAALDQNHVTASGDAFLGRAFTDGELAAVANGIVDACDMNDGIKDGMVLNPEACQFSVDTLGPAPGGNGVLRASQVTALKNIYAGPKNSRGEELYAGAYWDPGIAGSGWRSWKMGAYDTGATNFNTAINLSGLAGGSAGAFIFSTPPNRPTKAGATVTVPAAQPDALTRYMLTLDMDVDAPSFFQTSGIYTTSAYDFMYSSSIEYDKFRARGSKLIVHSGAADPVFSTKYHVAWYQKLIDKYGNDGAQSFARLFVVPGMNHGGGGPSANSYDPFSSLVKWVEEDTAPDRIVATTTGDNADLARLAIKIPADRKRPLCPYPQFAFYSGSGDPELDASFVCKKY